MGGEDEAKGDGQRPMEADPHSHVRYVGPRLLPPEVTEVVSFAESLRGPTRVDVSVLDVAERPPLVRCPRPPGGSFVYRASATAPTSLSASLARFETPGEVDPEAGVVARRRRQQPPVDGLELR